MTIAEILTILLIHWFADFVMQTDWQAKNKSKSWKPLLAHTGTYSLVWLMIGGPIFYATSSLSFFDSFAVVFVFTMITFALHTITDFITSRINSRLWAEGKVHNFFVSVGFDQVLHYAQLFLTYELLKP
jgi:hypothetical protein